MSVAITPGWTFVSIGFEGDPVSLQGVDPWQHPWRRRGASITVAHPSYPAERHTMFVCELTAQKRTIEFAAGEFSNGVWGFFLPSA
jgi:hypothetical protein